MAGLGAQRLLANDRVDPYIAVYVPPEPSSIGDATLLRHTGFLPPAFVQTTIDACIADTSHSLVAITCHGFPTTPVAYVPLGKDGALVGAHPRLALLGRYALYSSREWAVVLSREHCSWRCALELTCSSMWLNAFS